MVHYSYTFGRHDSNSYNRPAIRETRTVGATTGSLLTLAEAKQELAIVDTGVTALDDDTDARVTAAMGAVQEWCEQQTYRVFAATSDREVALDRWPDGEFRLSDPPLISVTAIKYYDESNVEQTVPNTQYDVLTPTNGAGRIVFNPTFERPGLYERADAVTIEYQAGYGTVDDIPAAAKLAARLMLSFYWDNDRENSVLATYERSAVSLLHGLAWGEYA